MTDVIRGRGSDSKFMAQGRLLNMESALLDELNKGASKGNQVIRDCISSKATILMNLALATTNAGMAQSLGQEVAGLIGIVGGVASIGGGCLGAYSAGNQLGELNNIGNVEDDVAVNAAREAGAGAAEGDAVAVVERLDAANPVDDVHPGLSEVDKRIAKEAIKQRWRSMDTWSQLLGQGVGGLTQGFSQLAQSPFTAIQAKEQAAAQVCQGVSETTSNLTGSTESIVQTLQGTFGQVANMPSQSVQWAVLLAQAH